MGIEIDRLVLAQYADQPHGDALRQDHGYAAADTDDLDVRDRTQFRQYPVEFFVGEQQRVAAGDDDVANLRVLTQILEAAFDGVTVDQHALATDLALAGAEAAVHGTFGADQEQGPVRVTMYQVGHRALVLLLERVGITDRVVDFLHGRNSLPPDRIVNLLDQAQVVWIDPHRVLLGNLFERLRVDAVLASQVAGFGNACLQKFLPCFHRLMFSFVRDQKRLT